MVTRAPEPGVVLEFGEFLQSIGRTADAQAQYNIVETTQKLFEANGVEVIDLDSTACRDLLTGFITAHPGIWNEDIGVD